MCQQHNYIISKQNNPETRTISHGFGVSLSDGQETLSQAGPLSSLYFIRLLFAKHYRLGRHCYCIEKSQIPRGFLNSIRTGSLVQYQTRRKSIHQNYNHIESFRAPNKKKSEENFIQMKTRSNRNSRNSPYQRTRDLQNTEG